MGKKKVKTNNQNYFKKEDKNLKKNGSSKCNLEKNVTNNLNKSTNLSKNGVVLTRLNGLVNLGNTCYFNAILQILVHSPLLYEFVNQKSNEGTEWKAYKKADLMKKFKLILYSKQKVNEESDDSSDFNSFLLTCLSSPSPLTKAFVNLLREMRTKTSSSVNPFHLLEEIGKKNSHFKGRSQQDSHELLRCLLDYIKADEMRRHRKAILSALNIKNVPNIKYDSETKALAKSFSNSSNFTSIDSLLGGYLLSYVKCEECESTSMIFEPFFDLSLSLYNEKQKYNSSFGKRIDDKKPEAKGENFEGQNLNRRNAKSRRKAKRQEKAIEKLKFKKNKNSENNPITKKKLDPKKSKTDATNDTNMSSLIYNEKSSTAIKNESKEDSSNNKVNNENTNFIQNTSTSNCLHDDSKLKDLFNYKCKDLKEINFEKNLCNSNLKDSNLMSDKSFIKADGDKSICVDSTEKINDNIFDVATTSSVEPSINLKFKKNNLKCEPKFLNAKEDRETSINPVDAFNLFENTNEYQKTKAEINLSNVDLCLQSLNNLHLNGDCDTDDGNSVTVNWTLNDNLDESLKEDEEDVINNNEGDNFADIEADNEEEYENDLCSIVNGINHSSEDERLENYEKNKSKNRIRTSFVGTEEEIKAKNKWVLTPLSLFRSFESSSPSLYSCLSNFTSAELLAGSNKIICENCSQRYKKKFNNEKKVYANASKQMLIAFPPPILTLHLKRFEVDSRHYINLKKINQFVSFPLKLNLSPFVSRIYLPLAKVFENHDSNHSNCSILYDLYGIVEHSGSIRSGHYTAYVKVRKEKSSLKKFARLIPFVASVEEIVESIDYNNINEFIEESSSNSNNEEGKWFYISDSHVSLSNVATVLSSQAYLLFYERIK